MASTCDFHEISAFKIMPNNFTELTCSMWLAESSRTGRCDVIDEGPRTISFVLFKLISMSLLLAHTWSWWKKNSILNGWCWNTKGLCQSSVINILVDWAVYIQIVYENQEGQWSQPRALGHCTKLSTVCWRLCSGTAMLAVSMLLQLCTDSPLHRSVLQKQVSTLHGSFFPTSLRSSWVLHPSFIFLAQPRIDDDGGSPSTQFRPRTLCLKKRPSDILISSIQNNLQNNVLYKTLKKIDITFVKSQATPYKFTTLWNHITSR